MPVGFGPVKVGLPPELLDCNGLWECRRNCICFGMKSGMLGPG